MYGDCRAETNADDGGEMSDGELYGDGSAEAFMFGDMRGARNSLPGLQLELAILMVRDLVGSPESEKSTAGSFLGSSADSGASSSMTINESTKPSEDLNMYFRSRKCRRNSNFTKVL